MRELAVFVQARTGSRRCPNKMLRPFSGSTLIDICLEKLGHLADFPIYFGAHEAELLDKAGAYPFLSVIKRSLASAQSHTDPRVVFEMLEQVPEPYVCWINPCHPFLEPDTVLQAMARFIASDCRSMTSVVHRKGWFYGAEGRALTNRTVKVDTSEADGVYEVAHAFHIYERERMLFDGKPWDNGPCDPLLHEIPLGEAWDIDTTEQFIMVEALYRNLRADITSALVGQNQ